MSKIDVVSPVIYIGFDPREMPATVVAQASLTRTASHVHRLTVQRLALLELATRHDWYRRPTLYTHTEKTSILYDVISGAPMSTEHAISRFFVPFLMDYQGWALFVDGDVLFRTDVARLFDYADDRYAVQCVQHPPLTAVGVKKDGHVQLPYTRKNWSSVMLFNCAHPANRRLDLTMLNTVPGRDLHRFAWLVDREIGALPAGWNHLVGVSPVPATPDAFDDIHCVHFTLGTPNVAGHGFDLFADEWWEVAARAGYRFDRDALAGVK